MLFKFLLVRFSAVFSVVLSIVSPILRLIVLAIILSITCNQAIAQTSADIEKSLATLPQRAERALALFDTPGMAIGIIHKGKILHLHGYGLRQLTPALNVTPQTQFRIGSVSKAFTAASLAILVDEGKLSWHDKVVDHLPDFKMKDPWVTAEFTVLDLLTHRSGLVSGAGDSMIWPEPSGFSRQEVVHNLRYLTPEYSFRSRYAYSNVLYITAAEIVAKITNKPWEVFVDERIFKPLGMQCFAGSIPPVNLQNVAHGYGVNSSGALIHIPRNGIHSEALMAAAAGGVVCNAHDMLIWLNYLVELYNSKSAYNSDSPSANSHPVIFSRNRLMDMWYPNTVLPMSSREKSLNNSHLKAYGLGWRVADANGHLMVSHTGTISGFQAFVSLLPEQNFAAVILTNGSNSGARASIMRSVLSIYLNATNTDWLVEEQEYRESRIQRFYKNWVEPNGTETSLFETSAYTGLFADTWFGDMIIEEKNGVLRIHSEKMSALIGTLNPFDQHTFSIEWDNKNAANKAFIHFSLGREQKIDAFTLTPYSLNVKPNQPYRDMLFKKVE